MSQEASVLKKERENVTERAILIASGTLLSRFLGLFRDIAMAALFSRTITDAWTVAFRIPNIFRRLFGEGAISAGLIPAYFSLAKTPQASLRQRAFLNSSLTYLFITLSVLSALLWIFMEPLLAFLVAPAYWEDPERRGLVLVFARIMVGFIFLFGQYACFVSILNILGRYAWPAAAAALLNVSMLLFTFMPSRWFAVEGAQLAWGVLAGGVLQSGMVFWGLRALGFRWSLSLKNFKEAALVLKNILLSSLSGGVLQFTTLINLYFASHFREGSISAFYWGDRLLEFPLALVSLSLGGALLPGLSEAFHRGDKEGFRKPFSSGVFAAALLIIPSAIGLFVIANLLVRALFYRGEFSLEDVTLTTDVVKVYALCLLPLAFSRIGVTALQSVQQYRSSALVGLVALAVIVGGAWMLTPIYQLKGLLYANLGGYAFHCVATYFLLLKVDRKLFKHFAWKNFLLLLLLSLVMGGAVKALLISLSGLGDLPKLIVVLLFAGSFYGGSGFFLGLLDQRKGSR